ncbi:MAG: Smr/MutS family protein [Methylovulum sp.]|nr:Smr/MutS family protein [Methylovulum sp.]
MTKKIPSVEDCDLFRDAVGKVRSVKNDKVQDLGQVRPKPSPKPRPTIAQELRVEVEAMPAVGIEDELSFVGAGVAKNSLVRLRQGYFAPEAEMDLHGLTSNAAQRELLVFLRECVRSGCRCVHIVHG